MDMRIGGEPNPTETLMIGNMLFGITLQLIQDHCNRIREELADIDKSLAGKEIPEKLRIAYGHIKPETEAVLAVSPEQILQSLQEVYDFVLELEKRKLGRKAILEKIKTERPDLGQAILKFYGILRNQTWGYLLGQEVNTFYARQKESERRKGKDIIESL